MKKYKLSILCVAVILVLSFMPVGEVEIPDLPFSIGPDKVVHFLMYGGLTFTILYERKWAFTWWAPVIAIILGCLVEVGQETLTTWRSGRLDDVCANSIGAIVVVIIAKICALMKKKDKKH